MNDLFGKALTDYYNNPGRQALTTWTNLTEEENIPLAYFFRSYEDMPQIEQKALDMAQGKVLDIGCGSGSHSLYLQNHRQLITHALDLSKGAITVAKARGVNFTHWGAIQEFSLGDFDTILLLMNGLGVAKTVGDLFQFLTHLRSILAPKGQILVDSSDLIYLFDEDDKELWMKDDRYYGEVDFGIGYQNATQQFPWLYMDFTHLSEIAYRTGFNCSKIIDGKHYDYLAKLIPKVS